MVMEASSCARSRAIGMVLGGMTQRYASEKLGVNIRTIRRWLAVIAKSITKKHQSTRKLAKRLRSKGCAVSHNTVRNYLRGTLKVIPFKPQKQPKLTEKLRTARLKFCRDRKT